MFVKRYTANKYSQIASLKAKRLWLIATTLGLLFLTDVCTAHFLRDPYDWFRAFRATCLLANKSAFSFAVTLQ